MSLFKSWKWHSREKEEFTQLHSFSILQNNLYSKWLLCIFEGISNWMKVSSFFFLHLLPWKLLTSVLSVSVSIRPADAPTFYSAQSDNSKISMSHFNKFFSVFVSLSHLPLPLRWDQFRCLDRKVKKGSELT